MASLIAYTKKQLIQRIRQHLSNDFPDADFSVSTNEVLLYIDQALAFTLVGQVYALAKLEGNLVMPDGYLSTFLLPALVKDYITGEWYSTLPQPPVSLPLGYSITGAYFADAAYGKGSSIYLIKNNRASYIENMPSPFGVNARVEGSKMIFEASNGTSLFGQNCYVTMASTRTSSLTDTMNLPDDSLETIFNNVVAKLLQRRNIPVDVIQDDLPSGATNVTSK